MIIPKSLTKGCGSHDEGRAWIAQLPAAIADLTQRWAITLEQPFDGEASCSWVAPCLRADGTPAVFKIGWRHMESEDEIEGMRFWAGDPTAYLLEADVDQNALLLERCLPGSVLRTQPEEEQDEVIGHLLRRLWKIPAEPHPFRPLSEMIAYWSQQAIEDADQWPDEALACSGLRVYERMVESTVEHRLLATDLHAGNVLRAKREPWLVIDPKPFVGDPAYDATQHLLNCWKRLQAEPFQTINRFAHLLDVDPERVRGWLFARLATNEWGNVAETLPLARTLNPEAA